MFSAVHAYLISEFRASFSLYRRLFLDIASCLLNLFHSHDSSAFVITINAGSSYPMDCQGKDTLSIRIFFQHLNIINS